MSSSTQLKKLIVRYGFNEIKNDMEWLLENNTEVKEIHKKEKERVIKLLKERLENVNDELLQHKWYGNEDDVDFKEEYESEYQHLIDEREWLEKTINNQ